MLWSPAEDILQWAVVLEPEVSLRKSLQMVTLTQVAIGDCLGALTPPKVAVTFLWPSIILMNGGEAGHISAAADPAAGPDDIPDWLVIGLNLRLKWDRDAPEPGELPDHTALSEEGGQNRTRTEVIESFSRHFMTWLNIWQDDGFKSVSDAWLMRAEDREKSMAFHFDGEAIIGDFAGLDENGGLFVKPESEEVRLLELTRWIKPK